MTSTPPRPADSKTVDLETRLPEKLLTLASFNSFDDTDSESSDSEIEDDEASDTQPSHDANSSARPNPAALDAAGRPSSPRQGNCLASEVPMLPRLPIAPNRSQLLLAALPAHITALLTSNDPCDHHP